MTQPRVEGWHTICRAYYSSGRYGEWRYFMSVYNGTTSEIELVLTESSWHSNDQTLALELIGNGDLVPRRVFHKLNIRNSIANLDESSR